MINSPVDFSQVPSPCYVLNENLLRRNLSLLQRVQREAGCDIICALKGFSMYSTFPLLRQYLRGATASSLNEARLIAQEMGVKAHVYAPAYLDYEFDELMQLSSHITFNSMNQWERYSGRVRQSGWPISCGIRINPQYSEVDVDLYNPCIPGTRLGITRDQLPDTLPEGMEGLHFHSLCEKDSFTLARTLEHVEARFGDLLHQVKWLNMGGGHLITRKDYQPDHLIEVVQRIKEKYNLHVILEPGSAIAWETGYLRASVLDILNSQGIMVIVTDISIANHMPDCLEMPYKPRILGATDPIAGKPTYRIGGLTCLAGDYVGDYSFDQPLQIGDTLVFDDMIHYTMVKTTTFNGVNLPNIGIWQADNTFRLVRTFGYESYKDRLS